LTITYTRRVSIVYSLYTVMAWHHVLKIRSKFLDLLIYITHVHFT